MKHCERNLDAAQQLRKYMESSARSAAIRSPRASRAKKAEGKRALNLSPAIASLLPQNSRSDKQKNEYADDEQLLMTHGLLPTGKKGTVSRSGSPVAPSPVPRSLSPHGGHGGILSP